MKLSTEKEQEYESMSSDMRDYVYRREWAKHVAQDAMEEFGVSETCANDIAERYVYEGRYDCNLSYWDNLNNLICERRRESVSFDR